MKVLTNFFQHQTQTQVRIAKCPNITLPLHPHPTPHSPFPWMHLICVFVCLYAYHVLYSTQVRQDYQNEYNILCQLPPHENIIHMWASFYDRANPDISPEFRRAGRNARTMCLFLLMDELPMNMKEHVDLLVSNQGPKVSNN